VNFRDLRADEIDCRVSTCSEKGVSLLLYKDARADMIILDETVGAENWQRSHELINGNLFCNVSIRCDGEWITKQDVGTESFTEKEKGQASDSFKRACFNWGLGRELYTAPFIWVNASDCNMKQVNGKWTTNDRFEVNDITIENKRITGLSIRNNKTGNIVYTFGNTSAKKAYSKPDKAIVQDKEIKCPKCGKVMRPMKKADGTIAQPEDILKGCGGICFDCYQAEKK
jgi:hypothetical protein